MKAASVKATMTAREVAEKYGVEVRDVLYATRHGKIKGKKIGWIWVYDPADLPETWPIRQRRRAS